MLTPKQRAKTRNHNIILEAWFPSEEAAINYCNFHDRFLYKPSFIGKGFIVFSRVKKSDRTSGL